MNEALFALRRALAVVATTLEGGWRKHPDGDGFRQTSEFHLERARRHLELIATGDNGEPHLAHAATRLLLALEVE